MIVTYDMLLDELTTKLRCLKVTFCNYLTTMVRYIIQHGTCKSRTYDKRLI